MLYSYGHVLQDIMPEMQKYWPDLLAPFSPEFWYVIIKVEYIHVTLNDAGDGKLVFLFCLGSMNGRNMEHVQLKQSH